MGTLANLEDPDEMLYSAAIGLDNNILSVKLNIFLPICFKICFGCTKEQSH